MSNSYIHREGPWVHGSRHVHLLRAPFESLGSVDTVPVNDALGVHETLSPRYACGNLAIGFGVNASQLHLAHQGTHALHIAGLSSQLARTVLL